MLTVLFDFSTISFLTASEACRTSNIYVTAKRSLSSHLGAFELRDKKHRE